MKDQSIQHELSNGVNMTLTCEERLEAEIAERRRLETALQQSEERLRSITSSIPMGMFALDPEGVITLSEGKGLTALGLKPGQVVGESIFDVYKDFPQVLADCRRALQGETLSTIVDVGNQVFETSYQPIYDANHQLTGVMGIANDVTERLRAEASLRDQQAYLRQIIDLIPGFVFAKDRNGRFTLVNKAVADAYGITVEALTGRLESEFTPNPEEAAHFHAADVAIMDSLQEKLIPQEQVTDAAGNVRWLQTIKRPIIDKQGVSNEIMGVATDITLQKETEIALREREALLQQVLDTIPQAVFWKDTQSVYLGCNQNFARDAGLSSPQEVINKTDYDMIWAKEQADSFRRIDKRVMESDTPSLNYVEPVQQPDGRQIWLETSKVPLHDANGKVIGLLGLYEDVTEHKAADQLLRESEQRLASLVQHTPLAVIEWNKNFEVSEWNLAAEKIFGYTRQEVLGKHAMFFIPAEYHAHVDTILQGLLSQTGGTRRTNGNMTKDGRFITCDWYNSPLINANGETTGIVSIVEDITERKGAEDQLTRLATIIEATSDFVGIASPDGKALYMNRAGRQMLGIGETEDISNTPIAEFTPDRMVPILMNQGFPTAIKEGRWRGESGLKHRNGQEIIVSQVIISNKDQAGNLQFLATIARDITEQKRNEEELQKLTSAVEQSENLVLITNKDGIIEYVNHGFERLTGYTKKFAIGKTPRILKSGKHDQAYYKTLWDTILAGKPHHGVSINRKKNGELYYEEKTITPIRNHAGEITHFLSTAQDITRRLQLEQEIRESLERRGRQVQLSTQVAQEIASAANLEDLYQRIVTQVKEQFGYYHAQLLQYNPALDTLDLVVGYGEVGDKMLALHHSIPMGIGLIGTAASTGQSVLRADVSTDASWQTNNLLPDTKGELVVPIKLGERVLGVLDVQSDTVGALTPDDQLVLEGLCGQIAIAIGNTLLRQEMEVRIQELNALQNYMTREGWQNYRADKQTKGYRFDHTGLQPLLSLPVPQTNGKSVVAELEKPADTLDNARLVSKPLVIRGGEIGVLAIQDDPERPLSPDEQQLLEAISLQVSEALEAARLFEQTQDALNEQERLSAELETVAQVSTAASTILEVDTLLQSVVDLTKSSFVLYHAHIYLLDSTNEKLILKAGAGKVGRLMVLEGREIPILADSLVARAARIRQGVIENDVRKTVDFLPNPLLPNTRSEMAIPMIVGEKLVGVLDLQSDKVGFFTEESLRTQKTLASQIAVAVENAKLYDQQVQTTEKLRDVDRLKSEFLASMSHELRTPLNSIIGFADVLLEGLDGDLNERMEEDVRLIRESGRHLRELIGDILDMSKIEAGKMELRYEDIDLHQLANDIVATAGPLASSKSLGLYLDIAPDVTTIEADRTRLRQVLWNIVGNAIKFTERGSVTLMMEMQEQSLLVAIKDTGIGIKQEDIPIVFEQFRQIDGSLNRSVGGTGLGMPITKKLVELHGGEIWVESAPGKGTTFWFRLPRYRPTKPTTASLPAL